VDSDVESSSRVDGPDRSKVEQQGNFGEGAYIKHELKEEGVTKGNFRSVVKKTKNTNMMDA
jgi:hypothetical protein